MMQNHYFNIYVFDDPQNLLVHKRWIENNYKNKLLTCRYLENIAHL